MKTHVENFFGLGAVHPTAHFCNHVYLSFRFRAARQKEDGNHEEAKVLMRIARGWSTLAKEKHGDIYLP